MLGRTGRVSDPLPHNLFIGNEGLGSPKMRLVLFTTIWWLWEAKVPYVQL
jgi:hypothetical protein